MKEFRDVREKINKDRKKRKRIMINTKNKIKRMKEKKTEGKKEGEK